MNMNMNKIWDVRGQEMFVERTDFFVSCKPRV